MEIVTLGTGSPLPDPNRAGPATLVKAAGHHLLFDCGRGVLMRAAAAGTGAVLLSRVLLTHLHSDHTTDFNDVLTSRWVMSPEPNPLSVIGPVGTARYVDAVTAMLSDDVSYRLAHHEDLSWGPPCDVAEVSSGVVFEADGLKVVAEPTDHAPVHPTVGYRVEADGKSVVIAGDTIPCEGLDRLCEGADLYVQTVLNEALVGAVPMQRFKDTIDYHSSIAQAATTAERNGVRTLVITHMVPAPFPGTEDSWIDEAKQHFSGEVVMASDLMAFEL